MPSFLKEISDFYGTGERNPEGQTLEEYLQAYDPYQYKGPYVTADIVVLRPAEEGANVGYELLMVQRKNHPCIGWWALPGGFAELREDLLVTAKRELQEETGLKDIPMEQLRAWGEMDRDPRCRIITVSYLAYESREALIEAGDDARDAAWVKINLELEKTEIVSEVPNIERKKEYFKLTLQNREKKIQSVASVVVEQNINTVLKDFTVKVVENQKIAFDHARIIVHALLELKK